VGFDQLSSIFNPESRVSQCPFPQPPSSIQFQPNRFLTDISRSRIRTKLIPRLILTYLIPLHLLHGQFPSPHLLSSHPRLKELFTPFIQAIQLGNIREYDERLEWAQPRLVGNNIYLVVERAREGCLRMLFKKA